MFPPSGALSPALEPSFFVVFRGEAKPWALWRSMLAPSFQGWRLSADHHPQMGTHCFFLGSSTLAASASGKKRGFLIEQIPPPQTKNIEQIPNKIIETIPRQSFNKSPNKSKSRFTPGPSLYSVWTPKSARKKSIFCFFGLGCSIGRCFGLGRCIGSFFGLGRCIGRCLVSGAVSGECLVWEAVSGVFLVWEDGIG